MQTPAKDYFKSAAQRAFPQTKMQTLEKDFLAGTTTSTLRLYQPCPAWHPRPKWHASGSVACVSPRLPFQLAMNLQVPPRHPAATCHPSVTCQRWPWPMGSPRTPAVFAASSLGQPAKPNLTYFHGMLRKGAKINQDYAASISRA